jgi:hypothetical protein
MSSMRSARDDSTTVQYVVDCSELPTCEKSHSPPCTLGRLGYQVRTSRVRVLLTQSSGWQLTSQPWQFLFTLSSKHNKEHSSLFFITPRKADVK